MDQQCIKEIDNEIEIDHLSVSKPCGCYIKILPDKVEAKTAGGIYIPESSKDMLKYNIKSGLVVGMGDDCYERSKFSSNWCSLNNRVYYRKDIGYSVKENEIEYIYLVDDDIVAVLRDPSK